MKVKELVEHLKKLSNQDAEIVCTTEDEDFISDDQLFRVFSIDGVILKKAIAGRDDKRRPTLEFSDEEGSKDYAFIDIVSVF